MEGVEWWGEIHVYLLLFWIFHRTFLTLSLPLARSLPRTLFTVPMLCPSTSCSSPSYWHSLASSLHLSPCIIIYFVLFKSSHKEWVIAKQRMNVSYFQNPSYCNSQDNFIIVLLDQEAISNGTSYCARSIEVSRGQSREHFVQAMSLEQRSPLSSWLAWRLPLNIYTYKHLKSVLQLLMTVRGCSVVAGFRVRCSTG